MDVLTVDYSSSSAPELFCKSLKETGFAVLTHHPIAPSLIEETYANWQDFFAREEKHDYTYIKPSQNGYFPMGVESAKNSNIGDLKEMYHYYPWGRTPSIAEANSKLLFNDINKLAAELLTWIERYLPQDVANDLSMPLTDMITNARNTVLRVIHYPPLSKDIEAGAVRASAHEDINLITLLPAATEPGLEVLDTKGQWHSVSCDPGNIVVNAADMLQRCTQHYYKSTTHRVVNPPADQQHTSRFSMPLFLHPNESVLLTKTQTAKEYLHERLREIGIY